MVSTAPARVLSDFLADLYRLQEPAEDVVSRAQAVAEARKRPEETDR